MVHGLPPRDGGDGAAGGVRMAAAARPQAWRAIAGGLVRSASSRRDRQPSFLRRDRAVLAWGGARRCDLGANRSKATRLAIHRAFCTVWVSALCHADASRNDVRREKLR